MAAIVSPRTWADNDPLNTSNLNAGVRDAIQQLLPIRARKGGDQQVSNATTGVTLVDDTILQVPVAANTEYDVLAHCIYTAGAGLIQVNFTGPASATMDWTAVGLSPTVTAAEFGDFIASARAINVPRSLGAAGVGTPTVARLGGLLVTSGTSGTLKVQFAQAIANAALTTMKAGSYLVIRQTA